MEDDPDRWYKMVLEDEQEMKSLDGSEEQRARAKEWQMIVKEFSFLTYEYMIEEDEEETRLKTGTRYWPLVKCVTIKVPNASEHLQHVALIDLPGTGDCNKSRDEMWKRVRYLQ